MNNPQSKNLQAIDSIKKKLLGKKLKYREIYNLMDEISHNRLSNILTTYFVAASFKEGFSADELYFLTKAMVETGNKLEFKGIVADKHSTGGLAGTRTTMIVVPIIASAGFKIPKISSRAITAPAGTADVMETLAAVDFPAEKVKKIVEKVGGCIVWNGAMGIAPADDIIIKVEEPLAFESFDKVIVSIMAKKVAVSANHVVLDIPTGKTMKIRHYSDAEKVAEKFKSLGRRFGMEIITDVNRCLEPAGNGIGPILEARDVLTILEQRKNRPLKFEAKALRLASKLLNICYKKAKINKDGEVEAKKILTSGLALKKFLEIVKEQKGNPNISSDNLKNTSRKKCLTSTQRGMIKELNNYNLHIIAKILGSPNDKFAGIYLHKKIDEKIDKKEPLFDLYASDSYRLKEASDTLTKFPIYKII